MMEVLTFDRSPTQFRVFFVYILQLWMLFQKGFQLIVKAFFSYELIFSPGNSKLIKNS